jgi:hypothetical protein
MDQFCAGCGTAVAPDGAFCAKCGRPVGDRAAPGPTGTATTSLPLPPIAVVICGAAIVVGSFLPWITATIPLAGSIARSGIEGGDGFATVILGASAIVAGATSLSRGASVRKSAILVGALAVVLAAFEYANTIVHVQDFGRQYPEFANLVSPGVGLAAIAIGAVGVLLAGLMSPKTVRPVVPSLTCSQCGAPGTGGGSACQSCGSTLVW